MRCGLITRVCRSFLLPDAVERGRELRQKLWSCFQIELHLDLVADLERAEHEARWLDAKVSEQQRLLSLSHGFAIAQALGADIHFDCFCLTGDRQSAGRLSSEGSG